MGKSWVLGIFGRLLGMLGFGLMLIGLMECAEVGSGALVVVVIGIGAMAAGSFLRYVSRHTVRVRG